MRTFFCLAALVSAFLACQVTGALGTLDPLIGRPNENHGSSEISVANLRQLLGSNLLTAEATARYLSQVTEAEHDSQISNNVMLSWMTVAEALKFNNFDKEKCSPQFMKERVNFYLKLVPLKYDWEDLLIIKGETRIRINVVQYCRAILQLVVTRCAGEELTLKAYDNYIDKISRDLGPMISSSYNPDKNIYDYGEFFVKEMPFETKILDLEEKPANVTRGKRAIRPLMAKYRSYLFEIPGPDQKTNSLNEILDMLNQEGPLKDPKETFLILESLITPENEKWFISPGDVYGMYKRLDDALYQAGYSVSRFTNLAMTIRDLLSLNEFYPAQCNRMGVVTRFNRYRDLMTGEVIKNRVPMKGKKRLLDINFALYNAARNGRGTEGIEDTNVEEESKVKFVEEVKVEDLNSLKGDRKIILNIIRYCRALLERFVRACTADGVTIPENELDQKFFDQAKQWEKVSEGSWLYMKYLQYINLKLPLEEGIERQLS